MIGEGIYMDGNGRMTKEIRLQWGESPTSVGKIPYNYHQLVSSICLFIYLYVYSKYACQACGHVHVHLH